MSETEFLEIPRAFLHAAVLIDDELYWNSREPSAGDVESEINEPEEFEGPENGAPESETASKAISSRIDAEKIVDSFSELGLICSTYAWHDGHSQFPNSTDKADLIILDWKLEQAGEVGAQAANFLKGRLEQDLNGQKRLRYVAIYTDKPKQGVFDKLKVTLETVQGITVNVNESNVEILSSDGPPLWRILYLSKKDTEEARLAQAILEDFAQFLGGLLPRLVMAGVAEIRNTTFQHLYRFNERLDHAAASHLLAKRSSELEFPASADSFSEFIVSLIVRDFSDALHGSPMVASASSLGAVERCVASSDGQKLKLDSDGEKKADSKKLKTIISDESYEKVIDAIKQLFGLNGSKVNRVKQGKNPVQIASVTSAQYAEMTTIDLLNNYPRKWNGRYQLRSGTIVRERDEGGSANYYVCVQPLCDGVRLDTSEGAVSSFPFLALDIVNEDKRFNLVLKNGDEFVYLATKHKLSQIVSFSFSADPETRDIRTAMSADAGGAYFADNEGKKLYWAGELKELYAMEIQNALATQGGRVGGNKFEWFRLKSGG